MLKGKGLLSTGQRRFLRLFSKMPDSTHFYLTGGTALAEFYLGHRYSFDLDLFRGEPRGARGFGSPCLQGEPRRGLSGILIFVNFGCAIGITSHGDWVARNAQSSPKEY
jgi:hypothetical protein